MLRPTQDNSCQPLAPTQGAQRQKSCPYHSQVPHSNYWPLCRHKTASMHPATAAGGELCTRQLIIRESFLCSHKSTAGADFVFACVNLLNLQKTWKLMKYSKRWLSASGKLSPETQLLTTTEVLVWLALLCSHCMLKWFLPSSQLCTHAMTDKVKPVKTFRIQTSLIIHPSGYYVS